MQTDPLFHKRGLSWFVIVVAVFLLRSFAWFNAELWYDEVLTLTRFVFNNQDGSLANVFRDYPIANNHILSTAVYWIWTHLVGLPDEAILRLPSIIAGLAVIAIVMRHWRKFIGDCLATIGGFMLAISPVFTAYTYQVRGYALTFLLAAIAVSGVFEILYSNRRNGQLLFAAASFLLPFVMPTNAMLAPALLTVVIFCHWKNKRNWKSIVIDCIPSAIATAFGAGYYLTIWEQFKRVIAEPDGWSSAMMVAANFLLAVVAHAAILPLFFFPKQKPQDDETTEQNEPNLRCFAITIIAVSALLTVLSLLVSRSGHAPFPRVYLVFLLPITAAVLAYAKFCGINRSFTFATLTVIVLCNGILWERFATSITDYQLAHNYVPDNLLQQYYRGSTELREMARAKFENKQSLFIVTDAYDIMSFRFYWNLQELPPQSVAGINELPQDFWKLFSNSGLQLRVFAKSPEQAADFFQKAGFGEKDALLPKLETVAAMPPNSLRKLYKLRD
ncbi:MAG: glycosyltransferase family 39 protein [Lentisphaeria bacterium]|nr:glycosyltransferase family 39 protein [Lentisphaeria bacterium]